MGLATLSETYDAPLERAQFARPLKGSTPEARDRIDRLLSHVHAKYVRTISLGELAAVACLSESGVRRMFPQAQEKDDLGLSRIYGVTVHNSQCDIATSLR